MGGIPLPEIKFLEMSQCHQGRAAPHHCEVFLFRVFGTTLWLQGMTLCCALFHWAARKSKTRLDIPVPHIPCADVPGVQPSALAPLIPECFH